MLRKLLNVVFAVLSVWFFSSSALALSPQDALSARQENSVYAVARIDDLNGLLRDVFSPANIELVASVAKPEEAQYIRLLGNFVSQIPAKSVTVVSGVAADNTPFLQLAASMPASVRSKLDQVADGTAAGVDLITLLLGDAAMMFAPGFEPEVRKSDDGAYYVFGNVVFAAKDDLLLITSSQPELAASLNALGKKENRLALKRRFEDPDYFHLHMDMPALAAAAQKAGEGNAGDTDILAELFKAPLEIEFAFSSRPGSFLISSAANVMESIADAERFKDIEPAKGANMFLAGGGRLLCAIAGPISLKAAEFRSNPETAEVWGKLVNELAKINISESDVEDLLNGSLSMAVGSDAAVMGKRAPGGYVALTGREGAAAKILGAIVESEKLDQAVPMAPLKVDGWDSVFVVDPSLVPVPLLFGRVKDTLFVGIVDSASLSKTPEVPGEIAAMLEEPLFATGALDLAGIWDWVRREAADPESLLSTSISETSLPEDGAAAFIMPLVNDVLSADLSVPFIKIWSPELEKSFMEFTVVDVPEGKRLLPKLFQAVQTIAMERARMDEDSMYEDGATEQPDGDEWPEEEESEFETEDE